MQDNSTAFSSAEDRRLHEAETRERDWRRWGTYLPERQWGTVREDYSPNGDVWNYFPFDMAQYRAYRWGEDGILGWTDRQCRLAFSPLLWNGHDPILKERLFGLGNQEGNHGEDVKELFYYLDNTPTHAYAKALYKYPQAAFPYDDLRAENKRRGYDALEYELLDTGVFNDNRYFDVLIEYAKADTEDTLIRLTVSNRGPDAAPLSVLPALTLRNNWSWHNLEETGRTRPKLYREDDRTMIAEHSVLGRYRFELIGAEGAPQPQRQLFTENDSNLARLDPNAHDWKGLSKDGLDRFVVRQEQDAVHPDNVGTRAAFLFQLQLAAGETQVLRLRLVRAEHDARVEPMPPERFEQAFADRIREADEFYEQKIPAEASPAEVQVARQAYAGLLWTKQFYYFIAERWLAGDTTQIAPPENRSKKTEAWKHLFCRDILSMPDKWEYPWFAAWDTAFHMIPMSEIDPDFAKAQLLLLLREWYMHPNGQMPAYEFAFSDVNPPVHAWAVWHVYRRGVNNEGVGDLDFLERAFQKLMLNFTWWVNRLDSSGRNLFGGGFLGLDNIGVFDRSQPLPQGVCLNQADGTAWMGLYCSCMLQIALELAHQRSKTYEDIASKFFEHYIAVIDAINTLDGTGLWDEEDGFYYDHLTINSQPPRVLKVKSLVGLIPLVAVSILKRDTVAGLNDFEKRKRWFMTNKPNLSNYVSTAETENEEINGSAWIAIAPRDRFERILRRVLDESQFLSPYGIRSLSREHKDQPFEIDLHNQHFRVGYVPAEGDSGMFGGNSNWRGPVWFPTNILLINALERYYLVYGDSFKMEYPSGSGKMLTLVEIAEAISCRLISLFLPGHDGKRPSHGDEARYQNDPHWKDLILFSEYFSGDDGRGLGASHQTGWTALAASLVRGLHTRRDVRNRAQ